MKQYKNQAHKICSWKYVTIWRPVPVSPPPAPRHRVPHCCSPPWTPLSGCGRSAAAAAYDLILVEVDDSGCGKCQFVVDKSGSNPPNLSLDCIPYSKKLLQFQKKEFKKKNVNNCSAVYNSIGWLYYLRYLWRSLRPFLRLKVFAVDVESLSQSLDLPHLPKPFSKVLQAMLIESIWVDYSFHKLWKLGGQILVQRGGVIYYSSAFPR